MLCSSGCTKKPSTVSPLSKSDSQRYMQAVCYYTTSPKIYTITEDDSFWSVFQQKVAVLPWRESEQRDYIVGWSVTLFDENDTVSMRFDFCDGYVIRSSSGKSCVSENSYRQLLAGFGKTYVLHKSSKSFPSEEYCAMRMNELRENIDDQTWILLREQMRQIHESLEQKLQDSVLLLKEPESIFWSGANGKPFTDPLTGETTAVGVAYEFHEIGERLKNIGAILPDSNAKETFFSLQQTIEEALENHDIGKLFTVHEYVHDYAYVAFGVRPTYDIEGSSVYFGRV